METPEPYTASPSEAVATPQGPNPERRCEWCKGPLKNARQKRFCSHACNSAQFDHQHPRLGRLAPDRPRTGSVRTAVYLLMGDGRWRTVREIALELGVRESSAGAKLRDLRKPECGGHTVDARPRKHPELEFRLIKSEIPHPEA
jgi:hypothetical protein